MKISLRQGKVIQDSYFKSTDYHQYLHYFSAHPYYTKNSDVFSLTHCINWLCTCERVFENHKVKMKSQIGKREKYPEGLISSEIRNVFSNMELKSDGNNYDMKVYRQLLRTNFCRSLIVLSSLRILVLCIWIKEHLPHHLRFHSLVLVN